MNMENRDMRRDIGVPGMALCPSTSRRKEKKADPLPREQVCTMVRDEQLVSLFHAFAERQDATFVRIAEGIIASELTANHHSLATELQRALEKAKGRTPDPRPTADLLPMPKDRRNGEHLISYREPVVSQEQIVLTELSRKKIERVLEEQRNRGLLAQHGYSPKRKLLFWGPPGCGKTFTADFIAYELGMPLGVIRLNAIISSFLGDTAAHIQRVFDLAESRPMVLLLDEVDAIAKDRDDRNDVGELKRVVNSVLQAMDAFTSHESLIIAASNHQHLLDPAVWRRFDEIVHFPLPTDSERQHYLKLLLNGVSLTGSLQQLSRALSSLSFADIRRIVVDSVKSMILRGETGLRTTDVIEHLCEFRKDMSAAKGTPATARRRHNRK
jgi:SpoVK/Ycf46/Vps4 family AAA+-type ATPase